MKDSDSFHEKLLHKMDEFVHHVYDVSIKFPREEQFGLTSQLRRAALSVVLNYIEGYARRRKNVFKNFIEISYGSLKETIYLLEFSARRNFLASKEKETLLNQADEISRMLWGMLKKLE